VDFQEELDSEIGKLEKEFTIIIMITQLQNIIFTNGNQPTIVVITHVEVTMFQPTMLDF
jgi:hypothetical protein